MARFTRLAAVAGAVALASAFAGGPASADTPEVFAGSALGRALDINILGQKTTLGHATSKVTSQLTATAEGAGQLGTAATTQTAEVSGAGSVVKPAACAQSINVAGVVGLSLACGQSSSSVVNGLPTASAEGSIAGLDLAANTVLDGALAPVTGPVANAVTGLLTQVGTQLGTVTGGATVPVTTTLTDLVNSIIKTKTLEATVGKATSSVVTEAGKVTSTGFAAGAVVKLLPLPQVAGVPSTDPVATITVSQAKASAVYDRVAGTSAASFDPAIVRVNLNSVLTNALGLKEINVAPGQNITLLQGTALETDIIVAAGKTVNNPDGSVGAVADGVKIHALKGVNGGIMLDLAHAEANVAGNPAVVTPLAPPGLELPRTGGTPWIPMAGVSILGLAVLARRVLVRAH